MDNSLNERLFWFISIRVGKKSVFFLRKPSPADFFGFFWGLCVFLFNFSFSAGLLKVSLTAIYPTKWPFQQNKVQRGFLYDVVQLSSSNLVGKQSIGPILRNPIHFQVNSLITPNTLIALITLKIPQIASTVNAVGPYTAPSHA